jgi:hypothetical protein
LWYLSERLGDRLLFTGAEGDPTVLGHEVSIEVVRLRAFSDVSLCIVLLLYLSNEIHIQISLRNSGSLVVPDQVL